MGLNREAVRENLTKSFVREERAALLSEAKDIKHDVREAEKNLQKIGRNLGLLENPKFVQRQAQKLLREKEREIKEFNDNIRTWKILGLTIPPVVTAIGAVALGYPEGAMAGLVAGLTGSALCALGAIRSFNKKKHLQAELMKLERPS